MFCWCKGWKPRSIVSGLAVSSHLGASGLLSPSLALVSAEPNIPWAVRGGEGRAGPCVHGGPAASYWGSCGAGQRTAMAFATVEKQSAGSPASFMEGTGWLGKRLLRRRCGKRRTNHYFFSSTFHFSYLNNDLLHFPRRGTIYSKMLFPKIYHKCHTHTCTVKYVQAERYTWRDAVTCSWQWTKYHRLRHKHWCWGKPFSSAKISGWASVVEGLNNGVDWINFGVRRAFCQKQWHQLES